MQDRHAPGFTFGNPGALFVNQPNILIMKKLVQVSLLLIAAMSFLFAKCEKDDVQISDLPDYVQKYLNTKYPGAEVEDPEQEKFCTGITIFEVDVETGEDQEFTLGFDNEGNLLFTAKEIPVSTLPAKVVAAINAKHPGFSLKEAERLEAPNGSYQYEVTVSKGKTKLEVLVSSEGAIVCEQEEDGE